MYNKGRKIINRKGKGKNNKIAQKVINAVIANQMREFCVKYYYWYLDEAAQCNTAEFIMTMHGDNDDDGGDYDHYYII